jgi:hypothetical protein
MSPDSRKIHESGDSYPQLKLLSFSLNRSNHASGAFLSFQFLSEEGSQSYRQAS